MPQIKVIHNNFLYLGPNKGTNKGNSGKSESNEIIIPLGNNIPFGTGTRPGTGLNPLGTGGANNQETGKSKKPGSGIKTINFSTGEEINTIGINQTQILEKLILNDKNNPPPSGNNDANIGSKTTGGQTTGGQTPEKNSKDLENEKPKVTPSNVEKFNLISSSSSPPRFRKSYSVLTSLTPFIKVFVQFNVGKKVEELNKNFIDIPYNFIKSLEVEHPSGYGVDTNFTLKLEDPTGQIGILLTSAFLSSGQTNSTSGVAVPVILLEFGWVKKTQKKVLLNKNNKQGVFPSVSSRVIVIDVEFNFSEKFKQEILIKGKQAFTGANDVLLRVMNSNLSPNAVLGSYPLMNLRVIEYYYFLQKAFDGAISVGAYFDQKFSESKHPWRANVDALNKNASIIANSTDVVFTFDGNKSFLYNFSSQKNALFNRYTPGHKDFNDIRIYFLTYLERSFFNYYFVLCYFLNFFKYSILKFLTDDGKKIDVKIISLVSEDDLEIEDLKYLKSQVKGENEFFQNFATEDVKAGKEKVTQHGGKAIFVQSNLYKIDESTTWTSLFDDIASKVKVKGKEEKRLYVRMGRVINESTKKVLPSTSISSTKDNIQTVSKDNFIGKLEATIGNLTDNTKSAAARNLINDLKRKTDDFIYIIISKGTEFAPDPGDPDTNIVQSYTVFPSHQSRNTRDAENFNSGSRTMTDEAYPDVISFSPKIRIQDQINSHLSSAHTVGQINSGILSIKLNDFTIETNNVEDSSTLIEKLTKFIDEFDRIPLKDKRSNRPVIYNINKIDDESFYIVELGQEVKIKTNFLKIVQQRQPLDFDVEKDNQTLNQIVSGLRANKDSLISGYKKVYIQKLVKKSENFSHGDADLTGYYNFYNSSRELSRLFQQGIGTFEAELKILGEPAFSMDWSTNIYVLIKVNNFDGSINELLSGLYMVKKSKHMIENGKFETTLTLSFISTKGFVNGFLG